MGRVVEFYNPKNSVGYIIEIKDGEPRVSEMIGATIKNGVATLNALTYKVGTVYFETRDAALDSIEAFCLQVIERNQRSLELIRQQRREQI